MDATLPNLSEFDVRGETNYKDANGNVRNAAFITFDDDKSFPWMYYRKPDGYITIAPGWPQEIANNLDAGWQPLTQYGKFKASSMDGTWRITTEPYRGLFEKGGAREFTLAQFLEHGWHRKSPYGVKFPQFVNVVIPDDVICTQCSKPFLKISDLTKHESVAHKQVAQQEQLSRSLATAMGAMMSHSDTKADTNTDSFGKAFMMLAQAIDGQGKILAALIEQMSSKDTSPVAKTRKEPNPETVAP